jgi:hypothetical protein
MAEKLGLIQTQIISPAKELLNKMVVFVPTTHAEQVRKAMFDAGAGQIGNYSHCSYNLTGEGTFKAGEGTNPFVGEKDQLHTEPEVRIETIVPKFLASAVVKAMLTVHPYEEPAYDIYPLQNQWGQAGSGLVGILPEPVDAPAFLKTVKEKFDVGCIRHTRLPDAKIKKVAICGGSGSFLFNDAIRCGADIFLTADIKYHQFFDAPYPFVLADIGHYESEQFTKELFYELLIGKFSNFAVRITKINTNPIKYV